MINKDFDTRYAVRIRNGITGRCYNPKVREITDSLSGNGKAPISADSLDFLLDVLYMGIADDLFGSDVSGFAENCIYKIDESVSFHCISLPEQAQRMLGAGEYRIASALTYKFCANPSLVINFENEPIWNQFYIAEYDELDFGNDFISEFIAGTPYRSLAEVYYTAIAKDAWKYFDIITQNGKTSRYYKPMVYCLYVDGLRRGNFGKLISCVDRYEGNTLSDRDSITDYAERMLGAGLKFAETESRFGSFDSFINDSKEVDKDSVRRLMRRDDPVFDIDNTVSDSGWIQIDPQS